MSPRLFVAMMVVTVLLFVLSAKIVEPYVAAGVARALAAGVLTGVVLFPLARWAEKKGWIKGVWKWDAAKADPTRVRVQPPAPDQAAGPQAGEASSTNAGPQSGSKS